MKPMQSPPFVPQFTASSATPPWEKEIIEDLKGIKISVSKIDKIEKMINKMNFKTARNVFKRSKNDINRSNFIQMRNTYNKIRKNAKCKHKVNEGKKLNKIAKTQPCKFWTSLKKCYNTKA